MYIDIITIIILVFTILIGLKKGFFFEILSFFLLILNFVLAKKWIRPVYDMIEEKIKLDENILYFLTYLVLLMGFYMITSIILSFLRKALPKMFLGIVDNILGGILGAVKGSLLVFAFLLLFNMLSGMTSELDKYSKDSRVNKFFLKNANKLDGYYPDAIKDKLKELEFKKKIDKAIDDYISN
jgi:membrane protein required for colicin V production